MGPGIEHIDDFEPNYWNPNEMDPFHYAKLVESVKEFGFIDPVTVRPHPEKKGVWQIIDGENRWRAARDAGAREAPYFDVGPISDEEAKKLTVVLNELRGQYDQAKMGELLGGLLGTEPMEDMLRTLPFTEEMVRGLIDMADFDWGPLEAPVKEKLSSDKEKWVERTFRLPETAAQVVDQALTKVRGDDVFGNMADWQALEAICADFVGS